MPEKKLELSFHTELPTIKTFFSTGSTLLDLAIADKLPGGVPSGRISSIFGDTASGKTLILAEILGDCQRQGGTAYLIDAEYTFDYQRAEELHGLNTKKLVAIDGIYNLDDLFDIAIEYIIENTEEDSFAVLGIDSATSIPAKIELTNKMGDQGFATQRAKAFSTGYRRCIYRLAEKNIAIVSADQVREKLGVMFGNKFTVPGGKSLEFYSSVRVNMSMGAKIEKTAGSKDYIGVNHSAFVNKNKVAPPFRCVEFPVLFDYGIDDITSCINWLFEKGVIEKKGGGWFTYKEEKFQGINSLINHIEENNLEQELRCSVYSIWKQIFTAQGRKKRQR